MSASCSGDCDCGGSCGGNCKGSYGSSCGCDDPPRRYEVPLLDDPVESLWAASPAPRRRTVGNGELISGFGDSSSNGDGLMASDPRRRGARGDGSRGDMIGATPVQTPMRGDGGWHGDVDGSLWDHSTIRIDYTDTDYRQEACPEHCLRLHRDCISCVDNITQVPAEHQEQMRVACGLYCGAYESCLRTLSAMEARSCPPIPTSYDESRDRCCAKVRCVPIPAFAPLNLHHCLFELQACGESRPDRYELEQWDWVTFGGPPPHFKPFPGQSRIIKNYRSVGEGVGGPSSDSVTVLEDCYDCDRSGESLDTPCDCLLREMPRYEFGNEYNIPPWPNSNTFVYIVGARCGLVDPDVGFPVPAPGSQAQPAMPFHPGLGVGDYHAILQHRRSKDKLRQAYREARTRYETGRSQKRPAW